MICYCCSKVTAFVNASQGTAVAKVAPCASRGAVYATYVTQWRGIVVKGLRDDHVPVVREVGTRTDGGMAGIGMLRDTMPNPMKGMPHRVLESVCSDMDFASLTRTLQTRYGRPDGLPMQ